MYQYDQVTMVRNEGGDAYHCHSNVVVEKELTSDQQDDLARYGYIFEEDLENDQVRIIVNRLDVGALTTATYEFYQRYQ